VSDYSDETLITGHEYDGIQEYDNPVPGWWHVLWYGSFLLAIVYLPMSLVSPFFVHQTERLEMAQQAEFEALFSEVGQLENTPEELASLAIDEGWMNFAGSLFTKNCASCHNADGGGLIGPNLADDRWINVQEVTDIYPILVDGAAGGAMPPWGNRMRDNELVLLAAYVASLQGTQPAAPKPPEGEIVIDSWEFPEVEPAEDPELNAGESEAS
jgi:cytochrome c oxidase cbb3-type subunit 3